MDTKQCTKCKLVLPIDSFYKSKHKKSGYTSWCKGCQRVFRGTGKLREILPPGLKRCFACKEVLAATSEFFSVDNRASDGLQGRCKSCYQIYRATNRERIIKQKKEYYQENRDEINGVRKEKYHEDHEQKKAQARAYYRANKDHILRRNKKYRDQHPEIYRRNRPDQKERVRLYNHHYYWNNLERERERFKKWATENPHKLKLLLAKRRARRRKLPDTFSDAEWEQCLAYWQHKCLICGSTDRLEIDHWIPFKSAVCPGHVAENVVVMCKSCNSSKRDKDAFEWLTLKLGQIAAIEKLAEIEVYFEFVNNRKSEE